MVENVNTTLYPELRQVLQIRACTHLRGIALVRNMSFYVPARALNLHSDALGDHAKLMRGWTDTSVQHSLWTPLRVLLSSLPILPAWGGHKLPLDPMHPQVSEQR